MMKKSIQITLITLSLSLPCIASKSVVTFMSTRSQSTNAARDLVGEYDKANIAIDNNVYWELGITPEITKTFRPERIAQCLFAENIVDCNMTFTVSGSQVQQRKTNNLLADYFGLPTDYLSTVQLKPQVNNALLDIHFFCGLDKVIPGLFFKIHAPLVHSNWDLKLYEKVFNPGRNAHEPGYFNPEGVPREKLVPNFLSFVSGDQTPQADDLIYNPLRNARMNPCSQRATKLSDMQPALGFTLYNTHDYHLSLMLRGAIPTGSKPKGLFLFEPIIGNNHHGELGAGISGYYVLWQQEAGTGQIAIYADANITHFFSNRQRRSFDLKNKPNSRYMLASRFENLVENNVQGQSNGILIPANAQFKNEVTSVANLTTFNVNVDISAQIDLALMLSYRDKNKTWAFGYNLWTRSCEKITQHCCTPLDNEPSWAIKGDARVVGFLSADSAPLNTGDPVNLSATQSQATIHTGLNKQISTTNERIDNPAIATAGGGNQILNNLPINGQPVNTSIQPVLLTSQDIDLDSARTAGISHKIFAHINCYWPDKNHVFPYIGFGAEIEFGRSAGPTQQAKNRECINCALSHWGVWIKTGLAFD